MVDGNLFHDVPTSAAAEALRVLLQTPGVRIERIVSSGQISADWYDQDTTEWVLVLSGAADLLFEDEAAPRRLVAGDYAAIAPHRRHRVTWTDPQAPTIWLAVHVTSTPSP
jgi:cupin 2 domain-containing protein